jgi:hypothetical protein
MKKSDIPSFTNNNGWTDAVKVGAYNVRVRVEWDYDTGAPWEEHDGHGPVSEWTTRDKAPGERVLCSDRNSKRYYDFAEAVKIAKRDAWDAPPYGGSKGERAVRAVEADFENLRRWCNNDWHWISVGVEVSYRGAVLETNYYDSIEDYTDYWREHAAESASSIIAAHRKERREQRYWEKRDVMTA